MFARDSEVTRIFRLATEGTSVEIVGPRWSGRTEILRRVRQLYDQAGLTAIVVRGVGDRLPLEAIRAALPLQPQGNTVAPAASPSALVARFAAVKPSAILIDDGDQLDDASWVVIEQVHKSLGTAVLGGTLQRPSKGPGDHALIRFAHPVVRVSLSELSLETVHDLLEDHLGGAVAPSLSGRIHTKSAGIPGFAIAIADAALGEGHIRKHGAVWIDGPDLWSSDLNGAFEALLLSYDVEVREAVETLALAGAVDLLTARALIGQPMIETLEQNALVRVFSTQRQTLIAVSPPGLGDYFSHRPLSAHRLRIVEKITETLAVQSPAAAPSVELHLNIAPEPRGRFLRAPLELPLVARMFTESYKIESAAAHHEWEATRSVASAIRVLNYHLTGAHDAALVDQVLCDTDLGQATDREELTFRYLHSRWILSHGGSADTAKAALRTDREQFAHTAALDALLYAIGMELDELSSDYESTLAPLAEAPGTDGDIARLVLAYGHILSSRAAEALPLLEQRPADTDRMLAAQYDVAKGLAFYGCGRLADAAEWAASHVEKGIADIERMSLAGHSYVAVIALASLGRFDETMDAARVVLSASVTGASLLFPTDRATMYTLAIVAMRMGRNTAAEGLLERADTLDQRGDAVPFGNKGVTTAAATSANGDRPKAAATYLATADALAARGYRLAADGATMLSLIAEFDPAVAETFRPRAEVIGGRLYAAYLDGRLASMQADPDGLVRAARMLRAEHAGDEALRFFTQAITIYRDSGDEAHSAEIRAEVRSLLAGDDSMGSWSGSRSAANVGLTSREAEIVQYVASGLGNSDIADRFGISIRTVETHLRNIRKKTGVVQREDIAGFGFDGTRR